MKDTTSTRPVKSVPPPVWEWVLVNVGKPGGSLRINDKTYDVDPITDDAGTLVGWRLTYGRALGQEDAVYDIDITQPQPFWTCDCADATYRQRECKHLKAMKEALPELARLYTERCDADVMAAELAEELDALEVRNEMDELLDWAEQTLPCAPVPCVCTDTSDAGCLRCRVQRIVWTRKWQKERAKSE